MPVSTAPSVLSMLLHEADRAYRAGEYDVATTLIDIVFKSVDHHLEDAMAPAAAAPARPVPPIIAPFLEIPFLQIAQTASDVIVVTTAELDPPNPRIVYANPAFTRLTGYELSEVLGQTPRMLQGPGTSRATLDSIRTQLQAGANVHEKILNYAKTGAPYWLDMRIVPLRDSAGTITHFAAIERDVTMDKRRLDELEQLADRDSLTGISNRRAFLRAAQGDLDAHLRAAPGPRSPCMIMIDVDHFKRVNDTLGHPIGDAVLCGVADRLAESVRRSDALGRVGGEEFAVCMGSATVNDAMRFAEYLRGAVSSHPVDTAAGPVAVTVSIGVAALRPTETLQTLMERADTALYAAKAAGRNIARAAPMEAAAGV